MKGIIRNTAPNFGIKPVQIIITSKLEDEEDETTKRWVRLYYPVEAVSASFRSAGSSCAFVGLKVEPFVLSFPGVRGWPCLSIADQISSRNGLNEHR